ncbi:uncharacterized protein LOC109143096 isoform X1 [Larimichthys crocea]|uniref:uncharacterized protein LOC109143096 isoform X1 n=1 Tax=Larimichthys crocea TaxID=215358 RepID=UPI000F5E0238|nr:uncharacterized protein LOC109143096 isoform X1 [Larimichthys crocea]
MEMWLKRSALLFFTVVVAATMTSDQVNVILDHNTAEKVEVPFGSRLIFFCNLNTTGLERFRMNLYFNVSGPPFNQKNATSDKLFYKNSSKGKDDGQDRPLSFNKTFDYPSIATHNNSGFFLCKIKIEIPALDTIVSLPREVVITNRVELTTHPSLPIVTSKPASPTESFSLWWLWIILGVSAVILSILLLMCILLRRRCRQSREEPVYANTHSCSKQPSPRMPVDNLKMVPSSQNLRNPSPGRRYDEGTRRQRH